MVEWASITVQALVWAGAFLLFLGHHLTDLLMWRTASMRNDLTRKWNPMEEGMRGMIPLHMGIALVTEIGAVVCYAIAIWQNSDMRSDLIKGNAEFQDGWTDQEMKVYITLAAIVIVFFRMVLTHQDIGTGRDIWDSAWTVGPWLFFHLAYAGGWILLGFCAKADKNLHEDWYILWGVGLIGGAGALVSALHFGRKEAPYQHPAGQFFNYFGRLAHLAGVALFSIGAMALVNSAE